MSISVLSLLYHEALLVTLKWEGHIVLHVHCTLNRQLTIEPPMCEELLRNVWSPVRELNRYQWMKPGMMIESIKSEIKGLRNNLYGKLDTFHIGKSQNTCIYFHLVCLAAIRKK